MERAGCSAHYDAATGGQGVRGGRYCTHVEYVGGVTHCRLHCRLAKSRGLTRRGKYGAVIGQKMRFFVCAQFEFPGYGFLFSQSQRRISPSSSNHGDYAERQCKRVNDSG